MRLDAIPLGDNPPEDVNVVVEVAIFIMDVACAVFVGGLSHIESCN